MIVPFLANQPKREISKNSDSDQWNWRLWNKYAILFFTYGISNNQHCHIFVQKNIKMALCQEDFTSKYLVQVKGHEMKKEHIDSKKCTPLTRNKSIDCFPGWFQKTSSTKAKSIMALAKEQ